MRYEAFRYRGQEAPRSFPREQPAEAVFMIPPDNSIHGEHQPHVLRIFPEGVDIEQLLTAMLFTAYNESRVQISESLDFAGKPQPTREEYRNLFTFDRRRSIRDTLMRHDTRVPTGIKADYFRGRAVKLHVEPYPNSKGVLMMHDIPTFQEHVGPIQPYLQKLEEMISGRTQGN